MGKSVIKVLLVVMTLGVFLMQAADLSGIYFCS
jgi:hypothetical protein